MNKRNGEELVDGLPIWEHVDRIKSLMGDDRTDEARELLLKCVEATEAYSRETGHGVAPYYYERLAVLYRREKKLAEEVEILERYDGQRKAPGSMPAQLAARLVRASELLSMKEV